MRQTLLLCPLLAGLVLAGCNDPAGTTPILAEPACEIGSLDQGWGQCKEGQVMAFLPSSWGNEQLPVVAAALYCDFHHPVVHTHGGVSCVFTGARKQSQPQKPENK